MRIVTFSFGVNLLYMITHMKTRASTADLVAAVRALHQRDRVRLLDDPYAILLCGRYMRWIVRIRPASWLMAHCVLCALQPAALGTLIRARYAEQALEAAVVAGITQYVIIGAGMDSFALRRSDLMPRLQVFEIDRPAMQKIKQKRLQRAGLDMPRGLHFVPADLERIPVMNALSESGFEPARRAFLSLLGVIYYLPRDVLASTVRSIVGGVAAGSQLVVDYMLDAGSAWPEHREKRAQIEAYVAKRGEPVRSDFSLAQMSALMAEEGFRTIEGITMMDLGHRYAEDFGPLPFEIPGLFGCGHFQK